MATGHWVTNRGKLLHGQGLWDDGAATVIGVGLLKVQSASADTEAEVRLFNTVNDLIVTAGCTECDFTNYTRKDLTRTAWAEDDPNNWAEAMASLLTWTSAGGATNNTIVGAFFYDKTTDTNDTTRQLLSVDFFASGVTTNGSNYQYDPTAGLYRIA